MVDNRADSNKTDVYLQWWKYDYRNKMKTLSLSERHNYMDNITSQSTVSIVIGTGNICRDKMVCERLAGNKGILLKIRL